MIFPIYFSHGYRPREVEFNDYFIMLFRESGFLTNIDPPSDSLNTAKLEKSLKYSSGLISVLPKRDDIVSKYMLYEIRMCLKLGKPALVFLEDSLPNDIIPYSIYQKRFSTKSYPKQVFEHMNTLKVYKNYIGDSPIPKYQIASMQKSCLIAGFNHLNSQIYDETYKILQEMGFNVLNFDNISTIPLSNELHFDLLNLDLALINLELKDSILSYFLGAINSYQIPNILFTTEKKLFINKEYPKEFQPTYITNNNFEQDILEIKAQIELFEEDFITLENKKQIHIYSQELASAYGKYSKETRQSISIKIDNSKSAGGDLIADNSNSVVGNRSFNDNQL